MGGTAMKITNYRFVWVLLGLGRYYEGHRATIQCGKKICRVMGRRHSRGQLEFSYQKAGG